MAELAEVPTDKKTGSSRILAVDDSTNPNCKFMYLQGDVKTTTKYFNKIDTRNLHYAINDWFFDLLNTITPTLLFLLIPKRPFNSARLLISVVSLKYFNGRNKR